MNHPLISVIIPCYNAEKYVLEAVTSIMNQSYKNLEILTIDDCSNDATFEILQELSFLDSRIKVIKNDVNLKLVETLNKGIKLAKGDFIARMDADDISLPDRLQKQISYLLTNPDVGIVGTFVEAFDETGHSNKLIQPIDDKRIKAYLLTASSFFHPTVLFRKELFESNNFFYEHQYFRAEDHALWVMVLNSTKGHNIPEVLLKYRLLPNSETRLADQDRNIRRSVLLSIHQLALRNIGVILTDHEQYIYSCSMVRNDIEMIKDVCISKVLQVYNKVFEKAKKSDVDSFYLKRYLGLRLIAFTFFSGNFRKGTQMFRLLLSSFFYSGLYTLILRKYKL